MSAAPELRPYQDDVIERIRAAITAGHRRILLVAPTGSGKTVIAGAIIAKTVARDRRAMFLTHRRELVQQAARKLNDVGVDPGVILPGYPMRLDQPAQVASIASVHARAMRSSAIELPPADVVVIDEAHHAPAKTYRRLLDAYQSAVHIGLTATPCRGDGRGLGNHFDTLIECPSVAELTAAKYLVPAIIFAPSEPDLSGVKVERGDYNERQLAETMDRPPLVGDIVSHWLRLGERRRTVVFATGVAHSLHLRDEFRRAGVLAEHIDGTTPIEEREKILADLAAGTVEVVCNAMVLVEGFDCPDIGCLVLARPTKSLGLHRQMVGRGLRPASGKTDCLILDHASGVFAHGFPDDEITWSLAEHRRAENVTHSARGGYNAPSLTNCPECSAVRFQGKPCPACGWRPRSRPGAVDVADAELGRVTRDRRVVVTDYSDDVRRRVYRMLLYVAMQRGYQRGWARHKYRERFGGDWPNWPNADPLPADAETRAWVRSRTIAFARAIERRGAA
jgi:DNA repair protein RadD